MRRPSKRKSTRSRRSILSISAPDAGGAMMAQQQTATVAETLATAIAGIDAARLPAALRAMADNLVLDVFGLCLAGRGTRYVRAPLSRIDAQGRCTVIWH